LHAGDSGIDIDLDSFDEPVHGVVTAAGVPVPGLTLTVRGEGALQPGWSTTTDETGRFRFGWRMLDRRHDYVRVQHVSDRGRVDRRFEDLRQPLRVELEPSDCLRGRVDMSTWDESMELTIKDEFRVASPDIGADGRFSVCVQGATEFIVRHPDFAAPLLYRRVDGTSKAIDIVVPPRPVCADGIRAEVAWNGAPLLSGEWVLIPEHQPHGMLVLPVSQGRVDCRWKVVAGRYRSGVRVRPSNQWVEGGRVHVAPGAVQRLMVSYTGQEWREVELPTHDLDPGCEVEVIHPEVGFVASIDPSCPVEWFQPPGPVRVEVRGGDGAIVEAVEIAVPPGRNRFVVPWR
jgi:hypothetical protein